MHTILRIAISPKFTLVKIENKNNQNKKKKKKKKKNTSQKHTYIILTPLNPTFI